MITAITGIAISINTTTAPCMPLNTDGAFDFAFIRCPQCGQ